MNFPAGQVGELANSPTSPRERGHGGLVRRFGWLLNLYLRLWLMERIRSRDFVSFSDAAIRASWASR
jgi:hypothetical protein